MVIKNREREVAVAAAREAGHHIRQSVNQIKKVSQKTSASDLVTESDRQAEQLIRSHITAAFPDHAILGEEEVEPGTAASIRALEVSRDADYLWIIDPIDGTTNFVHGFPFFCVSIALAKRGDLTLGVIYDPLLDEWFIAEKGKGATLNGEPIHVSKEDSISESLLACGFTAIKEGAHDKGLLTLMSLARNVRAAGSAALHLAYVAAGRLSGCWDINLNAWDVSAAVLLIKEAGGHVTDTLGRPYDLGVRHLVATNGRIHDDIVHVLQETDSTGYDEE